MNLQSTRSLYTEIDFTPPQARSLLARRAGRRRLVVTTVLLTMLGALAAGQAVAWRSQMIAEHERLVALHEALATQAGRVDDLSGQRTAVIQQLAMGELLNERVKATQVMAAIGDAMPDRAALSHVRLERTYVTTARPSPDGDGVVHHVYPAVAIEMRLAVRDTTDASAAEQLANFTGQLAADEQFRHVGAAAHDGADAADGASAGLYDVFAEVPLPDAAGERGEAEVADVR